MPEPEQELKKLVDGCVHYLVYEDPWDKDGGIRPRSKGTCQKCGGEVWGSNIVDPPSASAKWGAEGDFMAQPDALKRPGRVRVPGYARY